MYYKNEAGQSEFTLRHLRWSLPSESKIHIKAGQMFKALRDLALARLSNSNIFTDSCSANNSHLRNASIRHLRWSLPSESKIHIKAGQMFKALRDLALARLSNSNIFTDSCSANNSHLRNASKKLVVPLLKQ